MPPAILIPVTENVIIPTIIIIFTFMVSHNMNVNWYINLSVIDIKMLSIYGYYTKQIL